MQRFQPSPGYPHYSDNRQSSLHGYQSSQSSSTTQQILSSSPSIAGVTGAPISLASHPSTPSLAQTNFDTFDDIEWAWTSPTSIEHRHQLPLPNQHTQAPLPHAQHGQYAYGFSTPPTTGQHHHSHNQPFGPQSSASPHSPPAHSSVYGSPDANPSFTTHSSTPLSGQQGQGSYSTSPPTLSPLSSMHATDYDSPHHHHGHSLPPTGLPAQPLISTSLPGAMDYRPHFTFPSSSPTTHTHTIHTPQPRSYTATSPLSLHNPDWPSSPPSSAHGLMSKMQSGDSPSGTGMESSSGNGARPIRRRPTRKSESDTSYSSPAAFAARMQMQRSMSGGHGGSSSNGVGGIGEYEYASNGLFSSGSPSSPPNGYATGAVSGAGGNGSSTTRHKHSRSRSSGGSSSSPGGSISMLLSTSPTSPSLDHLHVHTHHTSSLLSSSFGAPIRALTTSALNNGGVEASGRKSLDEETIVENDGLLSTTDVEEDSGVKEKTKKRRKSLSTKESKDDASMGSPKEDKKELLPKKSLLQPPKASPSTWQIYFTDQLQLYRSRHPDQKLNVAQAAKELAQEYKRLSNEEREPYKRRALALKAERDRQMTAWSRTLTPGDVKQENAYRAAMRKDGKSRKANMKDPNAPRKPLSAYFMFLQRIRASDEMVKEVFGEEQGTTKQSVLAAAKWRAMSDEEKKPFLARAEQEKLIYEQRRRAYEESFVDPDDLDASTSPTHHHLTHTFNTDASFSTSPTTHTFSVNVGPSSPSTSTTTFTSPDGGGSFTSPDGGFTLSGHFVGIEQLSLNETFKPKLSGIRAFQNGKGKDKAKVEITDDDVREAMESAMEERMPSN